MSWVSAFNGHAFPTSRSWDLPLQCAGADWGLWSGGGLLYSEKKNSYNKGTGKTENRKNQKTVFHTNFRRKSKLRPSLRKLSNKKKKIWKKGKHLMQETGTETNNIVARVPGYGFLRNSDWAGKADPKGGRPTISSKKK